MSAIPKTDVRAALDAVRPFMPRSELAAIQSTMYGEEGKFFIDKLAELRATLDAMPHTYQTDGQGDDAIVHLHYFRGGCDWYITEKDVEDGVTQAFGWTILNRDRQGAELGYISIAELVESGVELDLYWTAKPLREVKAAHQ